jgi:MFS family permease
MVQWPLLHVRALYFVQCLAACCVSNFIVIFFKARGLDVHHIGLIIGGIYPFVQLIGGPFFCALADRTRMPKTIVVVSLLLGTAGTCCLLQVHGFRDTAIVTGCATFLGSAVNPMLDSTTMKTLSDHGVGLQHYGEYRVFGALGWGLSALAIGPMIDHFGINFLFYDYAVFSALFLALLLLFDLQTDASSQLPGSPMRFEPNESLASLHAGDVTPRAGFDESSPLLASASGHLSTRGYLHALCSQPGAAAFFVLVVVMGIAKGTIDAFLFIYLQDMGASNTLLGVSLAVTTVSGRFTVSCLCSRLMCTHVPKLPLWLTSCALAEMPFFFYSGPFLRRFGAVSVCLLALLAYSARLGYYSLLHEPWSVEFVLFQ